MRKEQETAIKSLMASVTRSLLAESPKITYEKCNLKL